MLLEEREEELNTVHAMEMYGIMFTFLFSEIPDLLLVQDTEESQGFILSYELQ